jgi:erythromycin esterase-like protein
MEALLETLVGGMKHDDNKVKNSKADINIVAASAKSLDYDHIVDAIGDDVRIVMIGEASHGTEDFYRHRAEISKRLIQQKGFSIVALESDFPDTHRVDNYVKGVSSDRSAEEALSDYSRYPRWMWRNTIMSQFVDWLRLHNKDAATKCGVFGLDIYSLDTSKQAVLSFLEKEYPQLVDKCRHAYDFGEYSSNGVRSADIVVKELEKIARTGLVSEELFTALQNARVVRNAAKYNKDNSWNTRDSSMMETLEHVMQRYKGKAIVWAHNSHLGDARKTDRARSGELNLGQLVRERFGETAMNIGFTTYTGTVTATTHWDEDAKLKKVNKGMAESLELLLHDAATQVELNETVYYFKTTGSSSNAANADTITLLRKPMLERAIGVMYRPSTERWSHYFNAKLSEQFDIVIHVDESRALRPLDIPTEWSRAEQEL